MHHKALPFLSRSALDISLWLALSSVAIAQTVVPGPADVGRVKPEEKLPAVKRMQDKQVTLQGGTSEIAIPQGAKEISFVLKEVNIQGVTAFTKEALSDIYTSKIGKEITLADAYVMAGRITERYRNAGYFLSVAYLPDQRLSDGVVTIQVVEGYVGRVELPEGMKTPRILNAYIERLTSQKPLSTKVLESFLLSLDDLPGVSTSGTLSALEGAVDGAVKLTLQVIDEEGKGQISFDNYSSRFLGPNDITVSYSKSLLPMQHTTVSGLTSMPTDTLNYATVNHAIAIAPDITWDFTASITKAEPGYTLEQFEIKSDSTFLSTGMSYQWIRQREENLSLGISIDSRNTNSDLLGTPFTRDRIRALRLTANYDTSDNWNGHNIVNAKLSKGIEGLGASKKGELNLSRAEAKPDSTKAELSLARSQAITNHWTMQISTSGQIASGPLFSAEEFGYGGQSFGHAYDASEISGDHGVSGSLELRYSGWSGWDFVNLSPYWFYDIGTVWNEDTGQSKRESGASAGFGARAFTDIGLVANTGLAWPLTRDIATPIYGLPSKGPRFLVQITQPF